MTNVKMMRCVGVLAVAMGLVACGERQVADPPADVETTEAMGTEVMEAPETMGTVESPVMEGGGPEVPRTGDDGVAVSLPGLPVGGGVVDDELGVRQCVVVSWLGSTDVPDGVSVAVTGVHFDPTGVFEVDGGSCGGSPACAEPFAFTSAQESCSVPVRALASDGESTDLLLSGSALCASGEERKCRDVAAGNSGRSIPLDQPFEEAPEEEEPPPTTETTE